MNKTPSLPRRYTTLSLLAAALSLASCATPGPDPQAAISAAEQAMGGAGLKSIRFAGAGTGATFGQAWQPDLPWPKLNYSSFVRIADYETAALREDFARSRAEPNGGGAVPLMGTGEQRSTGLVQGGFAWNMVGPAPVAAPLAVDGRIHDLWTTPHGVLKAARKNNATSSMRSVDGKSYVALSFSEPGRFSATAYLNSANLVERVESRQPNPVMGDIDVVTTYSDYKDYGGVKFPTRMTQIQGGHPVFDLSFSEVQPNVASGIATPELVKTATERVAVEPVAKGVWFLGGGSHNSVAIEMKDHLIVVETPLYDGRSSVVLAEARKLAPGKPIRYVINSHHHFDHAGGLRTAAAEGATLVTSAMAKPWFEKTLANPNRISPDLLAKSGKSATIMGVSGMQTLTDGERRVEVREMTGSVHAQGFMMVYLPAEKLLIEADAYTPGAPNSPTPAVINANNLNLLQNIEQNKLAVDRILPLHGRVVPLSELLTAVGRKS